MKKFFAGLCLLSVAGLMSCRKDKDFTYIAPPSPPAGKELLTRIFIYPDNTTRTSTYSNGIGLVSTASMSAQKDLTIDFGLHSEIIPDGACFVIKHDKLKSGYIGDYAIGSDNSQDNIELRYVYFTPSGNKTYKDAVGYLKITGYNETHKMISGRFSCMVQSPNDPMSSSASNATKTAINLTGSFENLPIKFN